MVRRTQQRTLETRARLIGASRQLVAETGYERLRVEDVTARAGTAKGTFFAHFADKETLMDQLIGQEIDLYLDRIEIVGPPQTIDQLVELLLPRLKFMTSERYVFDVIIRRSGAAAIEEIGPIAMTFDRHLGIITRWLDGDAFRSDVPPSILAEGIQAFETQVMAMHFCALHNGLSLKERLLPYLHAWLR